jgi:hypothetical protein
VSVRCVFPHTAVFQSATPAYRTSYRSSLGVVRARAARACVLVWRDVPRKACARAGVARRAAKKKKKKVPAKEGQRTKVQDKKESCVRAARLGSAMAAAPLCVRSDLSDASLVQGARGAPILCGGGNCLRVRVSWRGKACRQKEEEKNAGQRRTMDKGLRPKRKLRACRRVWECYGGSAAVRAKYCLVVSSIQPPPDFPSSPARPWRRR